MSVILPNGRKFSLGYRPDPVDARDFRMTASSLESLPWHVDNRARVRRILDQGPEGACTGFAVCAAAELMFGVCCEDRPIPDLSARWAYRKAREHDPWPGENYEGSTLRAALDGWLRHGICEASFWPYSPYEAAEDGKNFNLLGHEREPGPGADENARRYPLTAYHRLLNVVEVKRAIHEKGVALVGASIHSGWQLVGQDRIRFHEGVRFLGLHAFIVVGYDDREAAFHVVNSWGTTWGDRGCARLSYEDLRVNMIDAWAATIPCRCEP